MVTANWRGRLTTIGLMALEIEFCGDRIAIDRSPFTIGRDADLALDDTNRHLHRQFLQLSETNGVWLLANVGSRLSATVADPEGRLEAFVSPGAVLPIVLAESSVRFTAGPTTYEFAIHLAEPLLCEPAVEPQRDGDTTFGRVTMTPDQLRLILALAEPALRGSGRSSTSLPSNQEAARRLGWRLTRFNRKLDNVCQKLAVRGVRGLHGEPGRLATNRRGRLVEYAIAVRMVTKDDLILLDHAAGSAHADGG
jgi:hypothetical protein